MNHQRGLSLELTRMQIAAALLFTCVLLAFPGGSSSPSHRKEASPPISLLDEIYAPFDTLRTDLRDYIWPTNASTTITSSFADYRRTHFHEGIDISTNKQRGYPVYATRDGYVRHIQVSRRGYGKMLSIRHRDGFVTLYAHLQKFKDPIDTYVRKYQKQQKRYSLEIDLDSTMFPVRKGEIIAYTGDTGVGSAHLHFEVRDSCMNPINPLMLPHFASLLQDTVPPVFRMIALSPLDRASRVRGRASLWVGDVRRLGPSEYLARGPLRVSGPIGVSVRVTDRSDTPKYKIGAYRFETFLDGERLFVSAKKFMPDLEVHEIGWYFDRTPALRRMGRFEKLYIQPGNRLPFYDRLPEGAGVIEAANLIPGRHELKIAAWDLAGNESDLTISLLVTEPSRR
jgi:hypothetical protein